MLGWACGDAFGFREVLRYTGEEGYVNHPRWKTARGAYTMGGPRSNEVRNARDVGRVTFGISLSCVEDVKRAYERATRPAGAEVTEVPGTKQGLR
jgi:uncharacterized glyoxalase superfamily protein PhnB